MIPNRNNYKHQHKVHVSYLINQNSCQDNHNIWSPLAQHYKYSILSGPAYQRLLSRISSRCNLAYNLL